MQGSKGNIPTVFRCDYEKTMQRLGGSIANPTPYYELDGASPLFIAARHNQLDMVKYTIACGADINEGHASGISPLCVAASHGHEAIVKYLLEKGAEVDILVAKKFTPLFMAIMEGRESVIPLLVEAGADIERTTGYNLTSLHFAVSYGHESIVQYLLSKGANIKALTDNGETALDVAIARGHEKIVRCLVEAGADVEAVTATNSTPLIEAIQHGYTQIITYLLEKGANPERGRYYASPLYYAAKKGNVDAVKCLIAHGANIDGVGDPLFTPLAAACFHGKKHVVEYLVEHKADIHKKCRFFKSSLVHMATSMGHIDIVKYLLDHGADISIVDAKGRTPLALAKEREHTEIVAYLERQLSTVNALTNASQAGEGGNLPLHMAELAGNADIIRMLSPVNQSLGLQSGSSLTATPPHTP